MTTILFDTETTGLLVPEVNDLKAQPYIVSLYAVAIDDDFQPLAELDLMFKPPIPILEVVSKIHGIDDKKVANRGKFEDSLHDLQMFFLGADRLVAHNLPFDRSMLANELLRCDAVLRFPWPPTHICTVEKSMFIQQRRMSLSSLHEHCTGMPYLNAHAAKADVYALVRCYHWLMENGRV